MNSQSTKPSQNPSTMYSVFVSCHMRCDAMEPQFNVGGPWNPFDEVTTWQHNRKVERPLAAVSQVCGKRFMTASVVVNDAAALGWLQPGGQRVEMTVSAWSPRRCLGWWARPELVWNDESSLIYMLNNGKLICKLFLSDCHQHPSFCTSLLMSLLVAAACGWSGISSGKRTVQREARIIQREMPKRPAITRHGGSGGYSPRKKLSFSFEL